GTPDLHRMTGSKYATGFSGCIHRLKIGINEIHSFMDFALKGVNVTPCPSSYYEMRARNFVEYVYPPSVIKHTSITTKRKTNFQESLSRLEVRGLLKMLRAPLIF
ncbi:hypothetical protein Anas_07968, partial [Armadillidium nasatum]